MNSQEFKRQMSVGRTGGSTVAQRAQDTYTIKRTDFKKPEKKRFVCLLGIWYVEENGIYRSPTLEELLENNKGITK